jgi:hypothetical protein
MSEVVSKILSIASDNDNDTDGYMVHFWVGQEFDEAPTLNNALAILGRMDGLQRQIYAFNVQFNDGEFSMEPDQSLAECLLIFDKHDSPLELSEPLQRQWKTGQMAEGIVTHLVNANVFGVWRTCNTDSPEAPEPEPSDIAGQLASC